MLNFFKTCLLTLVSFALFDALRLSMVAQQFYKTKIGFIMAENPTDWGTFLDAVTSKCATWLNSKT